MDVVSQHGFTLSSLCPPSLRHPDTTFVGFRTVCSSQRNAMFMTHPGNDDLQHPVHVQRLTVLDSTDNSKVFIHRPNLA